MNEILTLITQSIDTDERGDPVVIKTHRNVFCSVASIGQKEFYQAQAVGLQPEYKFILADYLDYNDEPLVEYENKQYRVLRTYRTGQELELICYSEVNPNERT